MPEALDVAEERERRLALWADLKASGEILHSPSALNARRVFYGGRGIWVHQEETKGIGRSANGVTVGLLHTGSSYADDLSRWRGGGGPVKSSSTAIHELL